MNLKTKFLKDSREIIMKRWVEICLILVIALYIIFQYLYLLSLPVAGVHGWNESVYLSIMENSLKHNDPFLFQAAYDPYRPDYNVGFVFFWGSFFYLKTLSIFVSIGYSNFQFFARSFSLISTVASALLIYALTKMLFKNKPISLFVTTLFLSLPLTLHFGTKFQLEPFIFAMFLASTLLLVKFVYSRKYLYLIGCYVLFGLMLGTRQNMIVYLPALLGIQGYTFMARENGKLDIQSFGRWLCSREMMLAILLSACFTLLPSFITNLAYPQFAPIDFFIRRMFVAPQMAFYTGYQENLIDLYLQKSLIPSLGFSFAYALPALPIIYFAKNKNLRAICLGLYLSGLVYFLLTFRHNIIHMFHSFYFLLPVLLSVAIFASYVQKKGRRIASIMLVSVLFLQVGQSFLIVQNYYGTTTDRVYTEIDAYANAHTVLAGFFINRFYNFLEEQSMVSQNSVSYVLVQSPGVYFYTKIPSFSYYDFYTWSSTDKSYSEHELFVNSSEFTRAAETRNIVISTVTPDLAYHLYVKQEGEEFLVFLNNNFEHLCEVGFFSIYLNKTIFEENPTLMKAKSLEILTNLGNEGLCPLHIVDQILDFSAWYKISTYSEKLNIVTKILNDENRAFEIDPISNSSFTILAQTQFENLANHSMIFGIEDFLNVRTGGGNDIYLELPNTEQGYRFTRGVDLSQYLWQNLTVVFVYDLAQGRAETYFGNVLMESSLYGIPNGTFSELIDPIKFNLRIVESNESVHLYRIMIWNKALTTDELTSVFLGSTPDELAFDSAR